MTDETKIHITMKVNRGKVTETFTGWLNSGSTTAPEKALSLVGTPTFPDQYEKLITVTEKEDHYRVEGKGFIPKDDFRSIAYIVKNDYKGTYFAKGSPEEAHFKIPKVAHISAGIGAEGDRP